MDQTIQPREQLPPAELQASPSPTSAAHVPQDLPCPRCGYNLRTLAWSGVYPECGLPVRAAVAGHGFRVADQRSLRRIRYALGLWVIAWMYTPVGLLALTLMNLSTPLWLHYREDAKLWYTLTTWLGYPLRYAVLAAFLSLISVWLLYSAGLRRGCWTWLVRVLMLGCVLAAGFQAFAAVLDRITFKAGFGPLPPALPLWVWVTQSLCDVPVAIIPWLFLLLCVNGRTAPWMQRFTIAGLIAAVLAALEILLEFIVSLPIRTRPPPPMFIFELEPSIYLSLARWMTRYINPGLLPLQLAVVWLLVRRLYAAERAAAGAVCGPRAHPLD